MDTKILIIGDNRAKYSGEAGVLSLLCFNFVSIDFLKYMDLKPYRTFVLDFSDYEKVLRKISLGIFDDNNSIALWKLLSMPAANIFVVSPKVSIPSKDMFNLGLSYIQPSKLSKLVELSQEQPEPTYVSRLTKDFSPSEVLTADDIRELGKKGIHTLPANSRLTSWASEVATTLQIKEVSGEHSRLFPLKIKGAADLRANRGAIFELANNYKDLYFVLNPAFLPIFNAEYPILRGRTVSDRIHWAAQGAFTGEVSAGMLADQGCFGAIVPFKSPYTEEKHLSMLVSEATKKNIRLFSTFKFESGDNYDIMQLAVCQNFGIMQIYNSELEFTQSVSGALLVSDKIQGKEI